MSRLRAAAVLTRHAYVVWKAGQLRFRLETFGLYYPALPYAAPTWRVSGKSLLLFLRRSRSYAQWVIEMDELGRHGPQKGPWDSPVADDWLVADSDSAIAGIGDATP